MFCLLLYLYSIRFVTSLSSQEDLSITKYSQIGCLILKSDKEFIANDIQENALLPYQTFSSSHMTIELCFRLCRRWTILMFNNQTNCICLHTINKPYEFNEYLGEFLSTNSCTSNHVQIFSLTDDLYMFPSLATSTSDDWSLDGCYYLHGIQTIRVDLWLNDVDYILAIDLCRKYCQKQRKTNYYSYFLSRKKSCYCLPVKLSQSIKPVALRKPLIHCSFLPYICNGFSTLCEKYYSKTNVDTLIKIDVQHFCSSSDSISFVFDRTFYTCLTTISLQTQIIFSKIIDNQKCIPLMIKTHEQWSYLIKSQWITHLKTFIWIDRNSKYFFNAILKFENLTAYNDHICMSIIRTESNNISYEIIQCNDVDSPGYVLCAQKPFPSPIPYEEEFHMTNNESKQVADEIISCPPDFILFNKVCYYVHASFIYNIRAGERLCYNQYSNSTLVKYDSHDWGNINATRFLGRTFADILIEFFYFILENKILAESADESSRRHWLRLLFGDKNDPSECVLRYFARSSGAFTTFYRCSNGGHPVCQSEPIRKTIPKVTPLDEKVFNTNTSKGDILAVSTNSNLKENIMIANSTDMLILSNETSLIIDENRTVTSLADEALTFNLTQTNNTTHTPFLSNKTEVMLQSVLIKYRSLIAILTGPVLAFVILFSGIGFLICYIRRKRTSNSASSSIADDPRTKRSSTIVTTSELPSPSTTLHARLRSSRALSSEIDTLITSYKLGPNYENRDNIELATKVRLLNNDGQINEDDGEPFLTASK